MIRRLLFAISFFIAFFGYCYAGQLHPPRILKSPIVKIKTINKNRPLLAYNGPKLLAFGLVSGGGVLFGGGGGDCDNLGSYSIYWDLEHSSGPTYACVDGGTITVTLTSVTADAAADDGNGTLGCLWDGACNKFAAVPIDNAEISSSNGYIRWTVVTQGSVGTADTGLLEYRYDSTNSIYVKWQYNTGQYRPLFYYNSQGAGLLSAVGNYEALSTSTAYTFEIKWSSSTGIVSIRKAGDSWSNSSSGTVQAFSTEPDYVAFGEDTGSSCGAWALGIADGVYMSSDPTIND